MTTNQDNLWSRYKLPNLIGCFGTAHFRHHDVEHDNIGMNFASPIKSYLAILRFVDPPARLFGKQRLQSMPNELMIVRKEDCGWSWQAPVRGKTGVGGKTSVLPRW